MSLLVGQAGLLFVAFVWPLQSRLLLSALPPGSGTHSTLVSQQPQGWLGRFELSLLPVKWMSRPPVPFLLVPLLDVEKRSWTWLMGVRLCPGTWRPAPVGAAGSPPLLRTWLVVVYVFPSSLCPGGRLLSWLLGPLLGPAIRLCCERPGGVSCPLRCSSSLPLGWRKAWMGPRWAYTQEGLGEKEEASGTPPPLRPQGRCEIQSPVQGADTGPMLAGMSLRCRCGAHGRTVTRGLGSTSQGPRSRSCEPARRQVGAGLTAQWWISESSLCGHY